MSPTCPANRRELGQFKIWEDLLHLYTKILSPNTLETIERRSFLPALEYHWVSDGVAGSGNGETLDTSCPSGIEEEWDGKPLRCRRRWENAVERRDIETRSETIENVANCKALVLVIKPVKLHKSNAHHLSQMNLESQVRLPIHLKGRRLEDREHFAKGG